MAAGVVGAAEVLAGVVGVAEVVVAEVVGLAVVLGLALLTVGLGAAELLVGPGAGGPKQPVSTIRPESPRTPRTVCRGLAMMPPWNVGPAAAGPTFKLRLRVTPQQGLKSEPPLRVHQHLHCRVLVVDEGQRIWVLPILWVSRSWAGWWGVGTRGACPSGLPARLVEAHADDPAPLVTLLPESGSCKMARITPSVCPGPKPALKYRPRAQPGLPGRDWRCGSGNGFRFRQSWGA